jgi:hypothetical protein
MRKARRLRALGTRQSSEDLHRRCVVPLARALDAFGRRERAASSGIRARAIPDGLQQCPRALREPATAISAQVFKQHVHRPATI